MSSSGASSDIDQDQMMQALDGSSSGEEQQTGLSRADVLRDGPFGAHGRQGRVQASRGRNDEGTDEVTQPELQLLDQQARDTYMKGALRV